MSEPVTIMALAAHRLGRPAKNGADFEEAGLAILGGCEVCGATIAAYNACPTRTGFWRCLHGCAGEVGFDTVEEANAAVFG